MAKWLRRLMKSERGQAFAEYHVLFPGSILMVLAVFVLIAQPAKRMYCDAVGLFSSGVCEGSEAPAGGGGEDTPTPEPTEECIVLQQSEGCSQCDEYDNCTCLPGVNEGTYDSPGIQSLVIKAGKEYHVFQSGWTDDGCYYVELNDEFAWWQKHAGGSDCKDVSHLQSWYTPICQ
jgi:hypothetical protein